MSEFGGRSRRRHRLLKASFIAFAATEIHLFAKGGHAFGLHAANLPIGRWPELVEQ